MATSITVHQKREAVTDGYHLLTTITSATNIPKELFLFKESDDSYQHVCTVNDILTYPTTSTPGIEFYREDTTSLTYTVDQLDTAIEEAALQKTRLEALVTQYRDAVGEYVGEEDTTYTAS